MLKHADGSREAHVIGSIVDFLLASRDPEAVIERMARAETRIIPLTVTEGGYNVDPTTGGFLTEDPGVQHDLANVEAPATAFGFVTAAGRPAPGGASTTTGPSSPNRSSSG